MTDEGAWSTVRAQPAAVTALRSALRRDEVAHAWLFVGARGLGQRELARGLAAALNCPDPPAADVGCGECSTCERIARAAHPAATDFEPEGANHVVAHVREDWIPTATRSMTEGRRRVLRVVSADRMNEPAQNAFLKVLEEPPASVVWVLDVQDEAALLDTIISRCRRLDLVPWGPHAMLERAAELGVPPNQREALVSASMGLPDRLEDLADPDVATARELHLAVLDRLASGGPGQVVPLAKELTTWAKGRAGAVKERNAAELEQLEQDFGVDERGRGWPPGMRKRVTDRHQRLERREQRRALDLVLDDLASYLRDLLAVGAGAPAGQLINPDHEGPLRRDVVRLPPPAAVRGLAAIRDCRDALDRNGSPELQLERLLLSLALPLYATAA